jgi:hypothetical protein
MTTGMNRVPSSTERCISTADRLLNRVNQNVARIDEHLIKGNLESFAFKPLSKADNPIPVIMRIRNETS